MHHPAASPRVVAESAAFARRHFLAGVPIATLAAVTGCSSGTTATAPSVPLALPTVDTTALATLTDAFVAAWNVHDPVAFANLFTDDAQFTNPSGVFVSGRPAIQAFHANVFGTVFAASSQRFLSVAPQPLATGLATVDVRWAIAGATVPTWPPTQYGLLNWVLKMQADGSYRIAIMHNTIVPPPV